MITTSVSSVHTLPDQITLVLQWWYQMIIPWCSIHSEWFPYSHAMIFTWYFSEERTHKHIQKNHKSVNQWHLICLVLILLILWSAALSDSQSNFLLNGNFVVSMFKREITFKGAEIEYSGSNTTVERINCTQRIEEELVLQASRTT